MQTCYPWLQTQWQSIVARKQSGNFPHALLFTGMSGLGKLDFANLVANLLLCTESKEFPCGKCNGCALFAAKTHPDLFYLQPEEPGKSIKIDQIRELVTALSNTAQQGGYQVVIIEPADAMNIAAANALLKTLEEPNEKTVFILITNKPAVLPATIRSRCQQILFKTPEKSMAKDWLAQQLPQAQNLDLLLALANDSPLLALSLAQSDQLQRREDFFASFTKFVAGQLDPVAFAAACLDCELGEILSYLESLISDLIKLKYQVNAPLINLDILPRQQQVFAAISLEKLHTFYKKLLAIQQYLNQKFNLNKQLLLENLWLAWKLQ